MSKIDIVVRCPDCAGHGCRHCDRYGVLVRIGAGELVLGALAGGLVLGLFAALIWAVAP